VQQPGTELQHPPSFVPPVGVTAGASLDAPASQHLPAGIARDGELLDVSAEPPVAPPVASQQPTQHDSQPGHSSQHSAGHSSQNARQVAPAGQFTPQQTLPAGHSSHGQQDSPPAHSSQQHPPEFAVGRGLLGPNGAASPSAAGSMQSDQVVAKVINVVSTFSPVARPTLWPAARNEPCRRLARDDRP
jgi:hypothetical protein